MSELRREIAQSDEKWAIPPRIYIVNGVEVHYHGISWERFTANLRYEEQLERRKLKRQTRWQWLRRLLGLKERNRG